MAPRVGKGLGKRPAPDLAPEPELRRLIISAAGISFLFWILLQWVAPPTRVLWSDEMTDAAVEMARGTALVAQYCEEAGIPVDPIQDPGRTCLIGPRQTPLFTSLGHLEAKRTTLNPDLAGLVVHLLVEAGVGVGDRVAVGASGSFPGLLLATMAALGALEARPVVILSLGASSFGATRPEFNVLHIYSLLTGVDVLPASPLNASPLNASPLNASPPNASALNASTAAVSLGGTGDLGLEFDDDLRRALRSQIATGGFYFIDEGELRNNVARRMEIFSGVGEPGIAAFVNIGGAEANLGVSPRVLDVPPGLSRRLEHILPREEERGVLFEMAASSVPVIHLLNLRGLALRHGLPWDPLPLLAPGSGPLRNGEPSRDWRFWLLSAGYLGSMLLLGLWIPLSTVRKRAKTPSFPREM